MSKEAMKQALEALESDPISHAGLVSIKQAITALRQALETEREPVAWMHNFIEGNVITHIPADIGRYPERWTPLYTSPPKTEQEPVAYLHNETELLRLARRANSGDFEPSHWRPLYTAPQKREWVGLTDEQVEDEWERITGHSIFGGDRSEGRAMYISPDEVFEFFRAIEAKLKEKNKW